MRFSLVTVLAAAGLVAARPPCYHTKPPTCHLEDRNTGHHTIEVPAQDASVGSPFSFKFSDTTRNPADTSFLQLSFYNFTHRLPLTTVQFSKSDYTEATATVSVPSGIEDGGYALVVQELDHGNQLYQYEHGVYFSR